MGTHAKLSPSSAHRWTRCAASVMMCDGLPNTTSKYAAEGTVAHSLLEVCGREGTDPLIYLGQKFTEDGYEITVDMEMVDSIKQTIAYVNSATWMFPEATVYWERKVPCGMFYGSTESDGTADITIVNLKRRHLEVVDFKYGKGQIVGAEDNEQLDMYLLGALVAHDPQAGGLMADDHPFDTYRATIVQPRSSVAEGMSVSHDQTAREMIAKSNVFYHASKATSDPTAPFSPGEKACKWCAFKKGDPANGVGPCKAAVDAGLQGTGVIFKPIDALSEQGTLPAELEKNTTVRPESLSEEQLIAILDNGDLICSLVKDVKAYCSSRAVAGHKFPGHKLVESVTRRKWADDVDEDQIIKKLSGFGIKKAEATQSKLRTPKQILDLAKKLSLTEARKKNLEKLIVKPKGALSLVADSDLRKDAAPAIVFTPVEAPEKAPPEVE